MLAGRPPFRGQTAFEVALHHVRTEPEPLTSLRPDLAPELCAVVHKMMAKRPEDRYQTCRELLADLARLREAVNGRTAGGPGALALSGPVALGAAESGPQPTSRGKDTGEVPGTRTGAPPLVRGRRRWLRWAVAGSVLLSAASGAAVAWARLHGAAKSAAAQPAVEAPEPRPSPSEAERERFLQTAVQQYLKPSGANGQELPQPQVRMGLDHAVELALFYLDRWRLADADDLFARLLAAGEKVRPYQRLGQLGQAIVLGLQDRPEESNKLFLHVIGEHRADRDKFLQIWWLKQNPKLQLWIARALEHNAENAPESFPKELKPLRDPPRRGPEK
jgi:serine/threonine-protein kinase